MAAGGLVGSIARGGVAEWLPGTGGGFPTAALIVNLLGSFALGLYLARREPAAAPTPFLHFWAIGVLGSFTTFATFSLDLVHLLEASRYLVAFLYLGASLLGGLTLALAGSLIGRATR